MVGGVVIGITRAADRTHVNVADCPHYPSHGRGECPRPDTCSVYTDEIKCKGGERIEVNVGDSFWWQAGRCYWTPKENLGKDGNRCGVDFDIELRKLGYSH